MAKVSLDSYAFIHRGEGEAFESDTVTVDEAVVKRFDLAIPLAELSLDKAFASTLRKEDLKKNIYTITVDFLGNALGETPPTEKLRSYFESGGKFSVCSKCLAARLKKV